MRVIGVLDIKGGVVVRALRGQRERYAPLRDSTIVDGCDPLEVADALTAATGSLELYVADLDAIGGAPPDTALLARLDARACTYVDAGTRSAEQLPPAHRVVLATESLPAGALATILERRPRDSFALSLDLRGERLLARDPELDLATALALAEEPQIAEVIVIDLERVGAAAGPPLAAVERAVSRLGPGRVVAGGGVRDADDLARLREAGAAAALVSTALHAGTSLDAPTGHDVR